jgi:hypothetical protein
MRTEASPDIRPITPHLGAEVAGVDLTRPSSGIRFSCSMIRS